MATKVLFVRCCEANELNNIYLDRDCFRYVGNHEQMNYCPWCGKLLDMNLPMEQDELLD